jgi:hypothetical protein
MGSTGPTATASHPLVLIVAGNIRARMDELGVNLSQVSRLAGRAPSGLSTMVTGQRGITLPGLADVALALDIAPWRLLQDHVPCLRCGDNPEAGWICGLCGLRGTELTLIAC